MATGSVILKYRSRGRLPDDNSFRRACYFHSDRREDQWQVLPILFVFELPLLLYPDLGRLVIEM